MDKTCEAKELKVKEPDFENLENAVMKLAGDITVIRLYARDTVDYITNTTLPVRSTEVFKDEERPVDENRVVTLKSHIIDISNELSMTMVNLSKIRRIFTNN